MMMIAATRGGDTPDAKRVRTANDVTDGPNYMLQIKIGDDVKYFVKSIFYDEDAVQIPKEMAEGNIYNPDTNLEFFFDKYEEINMDKSFPDVFYRWTELSKRIVRVVIDEQLFDGINLENQATHRNIAHSVLIDGMNAIWKMLPFPLDENDIKKEVEKQIDPMWTKDMPALRSSGWEWSSVVRLRLRGSPDFIIARTHNHVSMRTAGRIITIFDPDWIGFKEINETYTRKGCAAFVNTIKDTGAEKTYKRKAEYKNMDAQYQRYVDKMLNQHKDEKVFEASCIENVFPGYTHRNKFEDVAMYRAATFRHDVVVEIDDVAPDLELRQLTEVTHGASYSFENRANYAFLLDGATFGIHYDRFLANISSHEQPVATFFVDDKEIPFFLNVHRVRN